MPQNSSILISENKTSFWGIVAATLGAAALIVGFNYWIDPFQQYREAKNPRFWHSLQRYITPGLIKRGDYDVAIVGSSMFEGISNAEASKLLGGKARNLSLSAISAYETRLVLELAYRKAPRLRRVLLDLNVNTYAGPVDKRWVKDPHPVHMWDDNPLNDLRYLFALDTLLRSLDIVTRRPGGLEFGTDPDMPWDWARKAEFSAKHTVKDLNPADLNIYFKQPPRTVEEMIRNFDVNIAPMIKAHPETKFELIHPPYSVIVWADFEQRKQVDVTLDFKRQLYARVKALPNATIYDFQSAPLTEDLNQYTDLYHYGFAASTWMLQQIRDGAYAMNDANIEPLLESQKARAASIDIKKLIESNR